MSNAHHTATLWRSASDDGSGTSLVTNRTAMGPKGQTFGTVRAPGAVNVTRCRSWCGNSHTRSTSMVLRSTTTKEKAYIALGSNMGDRVGMIEDACGHMASRGIKVLRTSGLWETEAMYVKEQNSFINGVCEVSHLDGVWSISSINM